MTTLHVFAVRLVHLPRSDYLFLLDHISEEARSKIERFVRPEDAHRTLIANILIRALLCEKLNVTNRELIFDKNMYGKPFLVDNPSLHYNISHSGEWVVCAIDDLPIGIDVERIQTIDLGISDRFFSSVECEDLLNKASNQKLAYFYDLWTLKESYIKAEGKGLSIPLNSFAIRLEGNGIVLRVESEQSHPYYFHQYNLIPGYPISVCAMHSEFPPQIEFLIWDDLLERFMRNCK
jgi:4'-phosphopantetheinyl transferase